MNVNGSNADMDLTNLISDLTDPITLSMLSDPIVLPCCQRAVSREPMTQWQEDNISCPLCRSDLSLSGFVAKEAPRNLTLASLIENATSRGITITAPKAHQWSAEVTKIDGQSVYDTHLTIRDSKFTVMPSLFIAVIDNSGSMAGRPFDQVKTALRHIVSMTRHNKSVEVRLIVYNSDATILALTGNTDDDLNTISRLQAGGGTNFVNAFHSIRTILHNYKAECISNVAVAFLTDGQDGSGNSTAALTRNLREILLTWSGPISVHSIGFGSSDRNLLENVRLCGKTEGTFRYADHSDNDDQLCHKLTGVFDVCCKSSTVPVSLKLTGASLVDSATGAAGDATPSAAETVTIRLPVDQKGWGDLHLWVRSNGAECHVPGLDQGPFSLTICSEHDRAVTVPMSVLPVAKGGHPVYNRWISTLVDKTADRLLKLQGQGQGEQEKEIQTLYSNLLTKYLNELRMESTEEDTNKNISFLLDQISVWKAGKAINLNKVSDMRFSTGFRGAAVGAGTKNVSAIAPAPTSATTTLALSNKATSEPRLRHYGRSQGIKNRNQLQDAIVTQRENSISEQVRSELSVKGATVSESILYTDADGNDSIMLAAYCGHTEVLRELLALVPNGVLNSTLQRSNSYGETAVTIAIKKRGFNKSLQLLLDYGAQIPADRAELLLRYAVDHKYERTVLVLQKYIENISEAGTVAPDKLAVSLDMTPDFVLYRYQQGMKCPEQMVPYLSGYLEFALARQMNELIALLLPQKDVPQDQTKVAPTFDMLINYTLPPKPDHPETDKYLRYTQLLLSVCPDLLHGTDANGDGVLHLAARKGSLPHLKYFISMGAKIDSINERGNTALIVASQMKYPCIVEELLNKGSDVNWKNSVGNTPLSSVCERGCKKVADLLVSYGADIYNINDNGDTLVLIACRNGQDEILEYLFPYVTSEFVNRMAHIDGFNAIMASAEANRPQCIEALHKYGIDLNQRTSADNAILAGATPLHIAAYYNRLEAAEALLRLGACPDSRDANGSTPLHIAVIQGHSGIIESLKRAGADLYAVDGGGNTPLSYCAGNDAIRKYLTDDLSDQLVSLAAGCSSGQVKVLSTIKSWYWPRAIVNFCNENGDTPLIVATLSMNKEMAEVLLALGANLKADRAGLTPLFWAKYMKNRYLEELYCQIASAEETSRVETLLSRIALVRAKGGPALFLGKQPEAMSGSAITNTSIFDRMTLYCNRIESGPAPIPTHELKALCHSNRSIVAIVSDNVFEGITETRAFWEAKRQLVSIVATDQLAPLSPEQCMAVLLYSSTARVINSRLLADPDQMEPSVKTYIGLLKEALDAIPAYRGEGFIGCPELDRKCFTKGTEFYWKHYLSASTMWSLAVKNNPSFTSKAKKGTVLVVKSKTGRLVTSYSRTPYDSELLFQPYTRFKVTGWYHGNVIALGQANIREHSFAVKEVDQEWLPMEAMLNSDKPLIIEITEME